MLFNVPDKEIKDLMTGLESYRKVIVTGEKPVSEPVRK